MVWFKIILQLAIFLMGLWYLYRLFHKTRGGRAMVGAVLLIGSLVILSELLDLRFLGEILKASSAFVIIMLIVVFQPELRRFFSELGEAFLHSHNPNRHFLIESIVRAVTELQSNGLGALIAAERSMINAQTRESGVVIDSTVSEELLVTIFTDKTPLHDGGVIIYGERIVSAGCIFPLTQQQSLDRHLGLRHRAAIGFSEESDAVVVALSEERGEISLALHGSLERNLDPDRLRERLTALLIHGRSRQRDKK